MELREILNVAESVIITAKSYNASRNVAGVQQQLLNLKAFLNKELLNQPAEPEKPKAIGYTAEPEKPAEPEKAAEPEKPADPEKPAEPETGQAETSGSPNAPKSGSIKPWSKDGSGVISTPNQVESKPDAGIVSEPDKSQNVDGSGEI